MGQSDIVAAAREAFGKDMRGIRGDLCAAAFCEHDLWAAMMGGFM